MGIEVRSLYKRYGRNEVLSDFSLALPDNGTVALMGVSGCGKTTLLRLIAGLEGPDAGQVIIPDNLRLSMVFQEDRLLEAVSTVGNIRAVLPKGQEKLADLWLERLGIGDAGNQYPSQLSGGMRRRLAVARAMAYGGDILLLDEPFKGLDTATKKDVMSHIFSRENPAKLVVLVTHDREEVDQVADQVLYLEGPPLRVVGKG